MVKFIISLLLIISSFFTYHYYKKSEQKECLIITNKHIGLSGGTTIYYLISNEKVYQTDVKEFVKTSIEDVYCFDNEYHLLLMFLYLYFSLFLIGSLIYLKLNDDNIML